MASLLDIGHYGDDGSGPAALRRQRDNIKRWLATGIPAGSEESKSISEQIDAAIAKAEGR